MLPLAARQKLARDLRNTKSLRQPEREFHSLPVGRQVWRRYCQEMVVTLEELTRIVSPPNGDFAAVQSWTQQLIGCRNRSFSLLLALEPFTPFERSVSDDLVRLVEGAIAAAADRLEDPDVDDYSPSELRAVIEWWDKSDVAHESGEILSVAFGLPVSPIDDCKEFRAEWVLQHYAYNISELLTCIFPHLNSLGIPDVTDILAAISIIGNILESDDPVASYAVMDSFISSYLNANPETAVKVIAHLEAREPSLRRTQQAVSRAYNSGYLHSANVEFQALALVDIYKRTVEGAFRQYSWAFYCLSQGVCEPTPMLSNLRERLVAAGGCLANVASTSILSGLRNSETHETLEWDGLSGEFVTEAGRLSLARVELALLCGRSFAKGCEAATAVIRTLGIRPDGILPDHDEPGRMPLLRRVRAYFGTNNLRLVDEHLNARDASVRVERLEVADVNPCFQALLVAHRLLPGIETFSVGVSARIEPLIEISAGALDATMPVWELAAVSVDRMPFSTFLPANFDARRKHEATDLAARAVAWIAVDDILDAFDGSPVHWDEEELLLLDARLRIVELAAKQTVDYVGFPVPRITNVASTARELRQWIELTNPLRPYRAYEHEALARLRIQWEAWGPVRRHPLVPEPQTAVHYELRPVLRRGPFPKEYRSI